MAKVELITPSEIPGPPQVQGFAAGAGAWPQHLQRLRPAAQRAVVGYSEIEPEQAYDGADQALRLPQGKPEHRTQGQGGQNC